MKMSRMMKIIEKKVPFCYFGEIETLIIADISKITSEEGLVEGNTVFISNEHYCEDLLIENFIISVGETLYDKYEHIICQEEFTQEFFEKKRDLYYDLVDIYKNMALSDFLSLEVSPEFVKYMRKMNFDDVIYNTQKYFVNYDSCLSLKKYFSHLFYFHLEKKIDKNNFKAFKKTMNKMRKICKEKTNYEKNN